MPSRKRSTSPPELLSRSSFDEAVPVRDPRLAKAPPAVGPRPVWFVYSFPLLTSGAFRDGPARHIPSWSPVGEARMRAFPSRLMEGSALVEAAAVAEAPFHEEPMRAASGPRCSARGGPAPNTVPSSCVEGLTRIPCGGLESRLGVLRVHVRDLRTTRNRSPIGPWCNGSTGVFGTLRHGSNPCGPVAWSISERLDLITG